MDVEGKGNPGLGKDPGVGTRTRGLSVEHQASTSRVALT